MNTDLKTASGKRVLAILAIPVLIIALFGAWFWYSAREAAGPAAGLAQRDRAAIEQVVREYILAHPEVLPEAMENLQRRDNAQRLTAVRADLERPFPGAVLGNPAGKVTLVEFTDFGCGYCRQSVADVDELIRRNPELRVVVRELPILSPHSADAARMGLAAAEQGKYGAFHRLMFAAGRPDAATIESAARQAGLDLERAHKVAAGPRAAAEIKRNIDLAGRLGFNGTPSWVVGDEVITGAVGIDRLAEAIGRAAR